MPGADVHAVTTPRSTCATASLAAAGLARRHARRRRHRRARRRRGAQRARSSSPPTSPGLEGLRDRRRRSRSASALPVTVENDVNLAAVGEQLARRRSGRRGLRLPLGRHRARRGLVLHGELHRGHHGAAGEVDYALGGHAASARTTRPPPASPPTRPRSPPRAAGDLARAALRRARDLRAPRAPATRSRWRSSPRRRAGSPHHVVPIAAVADVELVVLGGGIGANGDLLLAPIRELLAQRCPYPPRVEVSSLGDAAVLAVGRSAAAGSTTTAH